MEKIKILQVVPSLSRTNGVAEYICNYFGNIDKEKFEFTFLVLNKRDESRYNWILSKKGKISELFKEKNIFKYLYKLNKFFKENKFDIVHCHVANYGFFILYFAKKYNVKVRIIHSHATMSGETIIKQLRNNILTFFTKKFANINFACSEKAGNFMFKKDEYTVINNAIEIEKYAFSDKYRHEIRSEICANENDIVLGTIGRFCKQKNQLFLLDVLENLKNNSNKNYKLLLVGNGVLEGVIREEVINRKLEDDVIILTNREDTYKIYSAMDIFLLPSLYEGLPVVGIEAQANGLPIIFSNNITRELKIKENIYYLENSEQLWKNKIDILSDRDRVHENDRMNDKYNIKIESLKMEKIYENLLYQNK